LRDDRIKRAFLCVLEELRREYRFWVYGYVLMPEHFHLLISKPEVGDPSVVLQVLKQRVAHRGLKIIAPRFCSPTLSQRMGKDGAPTAVDGGRRLSPEKPQFWQRRFYDFNVCTQEKRIEKLRYMHRNPVKRGLVEKPEEWEWSSFLHYATGVEGVVEIESEWTGRRRERMGMPLRVKVVGSPVTFAGAPQS